MPLFPQQRPNRVALWDGMDTEKLGPAVPPNLGTLTPESWGDTNSESDSGGSEPGRVQGTGQCWRAGLWSQTGLGATVLLCPFPLPAVQPRASDLSLCLGFSSVDGGNSNSTSSPQVVTKTR